MDDKMEHGFAQYSRFVATAGRGTESFAADEIRSLGGTHVEWIQGKIFFTAPHVGILSQLHMIERVFVLVAHRPSPSLPRYIPLALAQLSRVVQALPWWQAAHTCWLRVQESTDSMCMGTKRPADAAVAEPPPSQDRRSQDGLSVPRFRISCKCSIRALTSATTDEISHALSIALAAATGWHPSPRDYNLEVYMHLSEAAVVIGLSLFRRPVSERVFLAHSGLRWPVCVLLTRLATATLDHTTRPPLDQHPPEALLADADAAGHESLPAPAPVPASAPLSASTPAPGTPLHAHETHKLVVADSVTSLSQQWPRGLSLFTNPTRPTTTTTTATSSNSTTTNTSVSRSVLPTLSTPTGPLLGSTSLSPDASMSQPMRATTPTPPTTAALAPTLNTPTTGAGSGTSNTGNTTTPSTALLLDRCPGGDVNEGETLIVGFADGSIIVSSLLAALNFSSSPKTVLQGHTAKITALFFPAQHWSGFSPDILVSGSVDTTIRLWNVRTGSAVCVFREHCGAVVRISAVPRAVFAGHQEVIATIARDNTVCLIAMEPPSIMHFFSGHPSPITALRWRASMNLLLVCCGADSVHVWQIDSNIRERVASGQVARDILLGCDSTDNEQHSEEKRGGHVGRVVLQTFAIDGGIVPALLFDIPRLCTLLGPESSNRTSLSLTHVDEHTTRLFRALLSLLIYWPDPTEARLAAALGLTQVTTNHVALGIVHNSCLTVTVPGCHTQPGWERPGSFAACVTLGIAALASAAMRSTLATGTLNVLSQLTTHFTTRVGGSFHAVLRFWSHVQGDVRDMSRAAIVAKIAALSPTEKSTLCSGCVARLPRLPYISDDSTGLSCAVMVHMFTTSGAAAPEQTAALFQSLSDLVLAAGPPAIPKAVALEILSSMLLANLGQINHIRIVNTIFSILNNDMSADSKAGAAASRALSNVATSHPDLLLRALSPETSASATASLALRAVTRAVQQQPAALLTYVPPIVEFVFNCMMSNPASEKIQSIATTTLNSIAQCCPNVAINNTSGRVVVGTSEGHIHVFDLRSASRIQTYAAHTRAITALAFHSDGRQIASYSLKEHSVHISAPGTPSILGGLLGSSSMRTQRRIAVTGDALAHEGEARLVWRPSGELYLYTAGTEIRLPL
eukprot:m.38851 g.38851  ORF g.38851 m.38851 type:complete len:1138 (+) comp10047_c0_seq2:114-3527(+)